MKYKTIEVSNHVNCVKRLLKRHYSLGDDFSIIPQFTRRAVRRRPKRGKPYAQSIPRLVYKVRSIPEGTCIFYKVDVDFYSTSTIIMTGIPVIHCIIDPNVHFAIWYAFSIFVALNLAVLIGLTIFKKRHTSDMKVIEKEFEEFVDRTMKK